MQSEKRCTRETNPGPSWAILLKRNDVNLPIYYLSEVS